MKDPQQPISEARRKFLQDAVATGGLTVAAVTLPGVAAAATPETATSEVTPRGYRVTQHILDYYKSASV
ncbi:MAG: formate dehydrogenase [Gammaproteobacteria bacterium]|nr:formate dehydrogenase [Gammaproteobacteria bacterium]MCP5299387.1 formate dehydrogenase [Chromatiaceae bacterium]